MGARRSKRPVPGLARRWCRGAPPGREAEARSPSNRREALTHTTQERWVGVVGRCRGSHQIVQDLPQTPEPRIHDPGRRGFFLAPHCRERGRPRACFRGTRMAGSLGNINTRQCQPAREQETTRDETRRGEAAVLQIAGPPGLGRKRGPNIQERPPEAEGASCRNQAASTAPDTNDVYGVYGVLRR